MATAMVGYDGHRGWVHYLAVKADQQGQRLGRWMMDAAEAWLREAGVAKLHLMVRHTNIQAEAFYRRLGYEDAEVTVLSRWLVE